MDKVPHPIDRHVGARVRMRRISAGVSQERLGAALGVTFQQVQKYEKGANRISASRLQDIAKLFGVPASSFFDGSPEEDLPTVGHVDSEAAVEVSRFLSTAEGMQLAKAFTRIPNTLVRRRLVDLVEALVEAETNSPTLSR